MGGSSTSHSAVLRRENGARPAYDLRSWQGLTDVLRKAKEKLSPTEHASFRDLVLQYAQQGGDVELKAKIDAVIARLEEPEKVAEPTKQVETVVSPEPAAPVPSSVRTTMNMMRRSAPRFMPKSISIEIDPIPEPISETETETESGSPQQTPEPTPVPAVSFVPAPTPEKNQVPEEVSRTPRSLEEHKARITEIKRLVNEQIGNPVALVGTHKELGREYMQALLAALKSTGGGGTGIEAAMRRLEDAFSAVITDKPHEQKQEAVLPPVEVPPTTQEEPVVIEVSPEPMQVEPVSAEPEVVIEDKEPEPVSEVPVHISQTPIEEELVTPISESEPEPVQESKPVAIPVAPKESVPTASVPVARKVPVAFSASATHASLMQREEKSSPVVSISVPPPTSKASEEEGFSETKYTQKKMGAASVQSLAETGVDAGDVAVRQSELVSPKITQALHDLLHEWSIFASSGLFGTGPSGPEHPLYIKLSHLSMGEIITGRYEGADRQVNNVIHDYVNAWRHEQGLAYTPSETFEHFLRRVVQRIQKRTGSRE